MDAGGLAQMSYNSFPSTIGVPSSGFASRGKGAHIKPLSFETSIPAADHGNGAPTPRTSRSHLLAGLRTAPKSATTASFPPSAPPTQVQYATGLDSSRFADNRRSRAYAGPKTSIGSMFPAQQTGYNGQRQMYALPEQVLAPPAIHIDHHGQEQMDPNLYAQLVATNMALAAQQQRLQQQLLDIQAAQQQFQGLNLGQVSQMQQQFATPPMTPGMYQQQMKQNMQPIYTPVAGAQPGLYMVYDPRTGQQSFAIDQSVQQSYFVGQQANNSPPQQPGTPRLQVSPPTNGPLRSISPPSKSASPPQEHDPLPPPSANAFRRGHKKATSLATVTATGNTEVEPGPRSALPRAGGFPATPMTGTFGPGQARAGEHPVRQPRGPPPLDELKSKPTTQFEGSKNFATRQRRNAVSNLVRAGMERRRAPGSAGSITPISEHGEISFSPSSDNDSDSGSAGSGRFSGRDSMGSSKASVHGAIGSDRPSSRSKDRKSTDSNFTAATSVCDEEPAPATAIGSSFASVFKNAGKKTEAAETGRKSMLVLTSASAEKRKSSVF